MTEEQIVAEAEKLSIWQRHKFMMLVVGTILIALGLVIISMRLYVSSGAIQLDLSRPGYMEGLEDEDIATVRDFEDFPSSGEITKESLDEFRVLYDERLEEATVVDSFGGDVMSDEALGIDAPN